MPQRQPLPSPYLPGLRGWPAERLTPEEKAELRDGVAQTLRPILLTLTGLSTGTSLLRLVAAARAVGLIAAPLALSTAALCLLAWLALGRYKLAERFVYPALTAIVALAFVNALMPLILTRDLGHPSLLALLLLVLGFLPTPRRWLALHLLLIDGGWLGAVAAQHAGRALWPAAGLLGTASIIAALIHHSHLRFHQRMAHMQIRERGLRESSAAALEASRQSEERSATRARQQAGVNELGELALEGKPIAALLQEACLIAARVLDVDYAAVFQGRLDGEETADLLLTAESGWDRSPAGHFRLLLPREGWLRMVATSAGVYVADETALPEALQEFGLRTGLGVAVRSTAGGEAGPERLGDAPPAITILAVFTARAHSYSKDGQEFLLALANLLGQAMQRHQAEAALRQSEERFRGAFHYSSIGFLLVRPDGRLMQVNPAVCQMLGYTEAELLERRFQDLTRSADLKVDLDLLGQGWMPNYQRERRYVHRLGHTVWVLVNISAVRDQEGRPLHFVAQIQDITARKRVEVALERLRRQNELILHSAGEGIFGMDLEGRAAFVNPAAGDLLGWPARELVGRSLNEVLYGGRCDPNTGENPLFNALREGAVRRSNGEMFWRRDGSAFPVEYTCTPMRDEDGELLGAVVTFRDVSERQAIERMKDEFVSVVSHELRTPLASIRGALGMLASGRLGALNEKGQRMLEIAANNTDRLVRLINDILDLERIQSGKITMHETECDAADVLDQAVEIMRPLAEKLQIHLILKPLSAPLWADPDRLIQTLTNLVGNAVKFSPPGGLIVISAEMQESQNQVLFSVKDQGRGIPPDKLELIFERFQQVDASDSREKGGTGLGLAICRSIVQQHGGRIWAESTPGEGSRFCFTLPLKSAPAPSARGGRIVVCDPDAESRALICRLLEEHQYEVQPAANRAEAESQIEGFQPAVLLLDPTVDGDQGWDLAVTPPRLKNGSELRLILLTTLPLRKVRRDPVQLAGSVVKPIKTQNLITTIDRVFQADARNPRHSSSATAIV